ncbi:rhodanese-like domain-containing protein [Enterobacteriaceae bacterium H11S18]|uniref:rhodanese-like domain-containing protein n=1 Tax=Dryocola clanedunensis TaxID=2925396 RepID=UPI0022F00BA5|nr:rhodanese-like domain-containing protein [Dryocola clanedunensis]MCT4706478.1 rhodanese-like domain-containing protein [Dryocola clanedunensis]MCT4713289.1 rhodanese-like domain-containing protein [Dryocola clanedunensis]
MSYVTENSAAAPETAAAHFLQRLTLETDCDDVHSSMKEEDMDFVLLHVVGTPEAFNRRHIPGAQHLRHRDMTVERMAEWPADTLFVVYCAGPHCNGADRAALKLARMGRPVKIMIGGITGWADEGFEFA